MFSNFTGKEFYAGRRKIRSGFTTNDLRDVENVATMVNSAMTIHLENATASQKLLDYYMGKQSILDKEKAIRPEINNKVALSNPQRISRTVTGYFMGTPIQYICRNSDKRDEVKRLNDIMIYEDKSAVDKEVADMQSITGTGYRIIVTDTDDDVPFETRSLSPVNTFVVYGNSVKENPLAGVTYRDELNGDGVVIGRKFFIYTEIGLYTVTSGVSLTINLSLDDVVYAPYKVGGVPIIEYPNNQWRLGDWELQITLMDAINSLESGRLDDVEQVIQSLLVFVNADIDSKTFTEMREAGAVMLKNDSNNKSDVKTVNTSLDQVGMESFSKELRNLLDELVGIPSRDTRGGNGGDTGQAVELRDGWADLEIVARNKELLFKRSEKLSLKIMLTILSNVEQLAITPMDIDVKFSRNKNHNLLTKTQSYGTLIGTKTLTPEDCLAIVDLVSDVSEYAERGGEYWDEQANLELERSTPTEPTPDDLANNTVGNANSD